MIIILSRSRQLAHRLWLWCGITPPWLNQKILKDHSLDPPTSIVAHYLICIMCSTQWQWINAGQIPVIPKCWTISTSHQWIWSHGQFDRFSVPHPYSAYMPLTDCIEAPPNTTITGWLFSRPILRVLACFTFPITSKPVSNWLYYVFFHWLTNLSTRFFSCCFTI